MLRIKTLRKEQSLSQRALAQKIGSSQKSIDYWEKEKAEPTAKFICALADCFGCSTDFLLGREDDFGNVNVQSDLSAGENKLLS
ncbi:MAG: helix-turn-helix domain-containing protein, partial [Clostridiales bacterium]|nr:helix-turn-helix domain-containing protein [Clostridiales bacterium]